MSLKCILQMSGKQGSVSSGEDCWFWCGAWSGRAGLKQRDDTRWGPQSWWLWRWRGEDPSGRTHRKVMLFILCTRALGGLCSQIEALALGIRPSPPPAAPQVAQPTLTRSGAQQCAGLAGWEALDLRTKQEDRSHWAWRSI